MLGFHQQYTLVMTKSLLLKMAIEIVSFPSENGNSPQLCKRFQEGHRAFWGWGLNQPMIFPPHRMDLKHFMTWGWGRGDFHWYHWGNLQTIDMCQSGMPQKCGHQRIRNVVNIQEIWAKPNHSKHHWEFQDPKMEVLYHKRQCFVGMSSYMVLHRPYIWVGTSNLGSSNGH